MNSRTVGRFLVFFFIIAGSSFAFAAPGEASGDLYERLGIQETAGSYSAEGASAGQTDAGTGAAIPEFTGDTLRIQLTREDYERLGIKGAYGEFDHHEHHDALFPTEYRNHYDFKGSTKIKSSWWARCNASSDVNNNGTKTASLQIVFSDRHVHQVHLPAGETMPLKKSAIVINNSADGVVDLICH